MRDLKEIEYWISKLEREESSFTAYAKLADLYVIRDKMLGIQPQESIPAYAESAPVIAYDNGPGTVGDYGDSEFLQAVAGKDPARIWDVIDELMETLKVVNRRAYDGVMRKIERVQRY